MEIYPCTNNQFIQSDHSVVPSSLLFGVGILGNIIALFILWQHKLHAKKKKTSVFYILVTGLTIMNLLGKFLVCPMVLAAYSKNQTLVEMANDRNLCHLFGFFMLFFGLAPTLILLAMAIDCWIALGYPFFYRQYITQKVGLWVPLIINAFSIIFCSMPFLGFGKYEQYCPGTWCFIQLTPDTSVPGALTYSVAYGTFMGVLVLAIICFNILIMKHLYRMHQSQNQRCLIGNKLANKQKEVANQVGTEELDHLILLAITTVVFAICSVPLTVRVYIGVFMIEKNEYYDLIVLRLLSVNSIVDPWIFIICRASKFHIVVHGLCKKIYRRRDVQHQLLQNHLKLRLKDTQSEKCFLSN